MKNEARTDDSRFAHIPPYKRVMLAVLGALVLMVLVNVAKSDGTIKSTAEHAVVHVISKIESHGPSPRIHVVQRQIMGTADEERMIDERFKAGSNAALSVRVGDADLELLDDDTDEIHVEVFLKGNDMERAREYFDRQKFEVLQESNTVIVRTAERNWNGNGWKSNGGAQIRVVVHAPHALDADIRTSDGDVTVGDFRGDLRLTTSDGDIATGSLEGAGITLRTSDGDIVSDALDTDELSVTTSDGDIVIDRAAAGTINIRTSDGDIKLEDVDGEVSISTSDGDIHVGKLSGADATLRTSDGDIVVEQAMTARTRVTTSDGSIVLQDARGDIEARTSSGDLSVALLELDGDINLRTGDGDIMISAPTDLRATLSMRGESIRIASGFSFDGVLKKNEAEGQLNGGGNRFEVQASSGEIVLREN